MQPLNGSQGGGTGNILREHPIDVACLAPPLFIDLLDNIQKVHLLSQDICHIPGGGNYDNPRPPPAHSHLPFPSKHPWESVTTGPFSNFPLRWLCIAFLHPLPRPQSPLPPRKWVFLSPRRWHGPLSVIATSPVIHHLSGVGPNTPGTTRSWASVGPDGWCWVHLRPGSACTL